MKESQRAQLEMDVSVKIVNGMRARLTSIGKDWRIES